MYMNNKDAPVPESTEGITQETLENLSDNKWDDENE